MVSVDQLTRKFGEFTAVDDLSFSVARGEVIGFLGPNGAGKSTTMKMITGFLAPSAGRIEICGADIEQDPKASKKLLGYLPEGAPMYGDMTTERFLLFVGQVRGYRGDELTDRVDQAIQRIQLGEVRHQLIETLSKGFKRRVGLAQAILHDPPVLILDEPTDGLDPNQKHEVRNLISEIARDKAIIISTHILEEVDAVCSRALIIDRGRLLADGTPLELETRAEGHNAIELVVATEHQQAVRAGLQAIRGLQRIDEAPFGEQRI
ncbi:MAG: ATP-binding cassette domain-containing protein, partial [Gammaproteobacteria bacterium]